MLCDMANVGGRRPVRAYSRPISGYVKRVSPSRVFWRTISVTPSSIATVLSGRRIPRIACRGERAVASLTGSSCCPSNRNGRSSFSRTDRNTARTTPAYAICRARPCAPVSNAASNRPSPGSSIASKAGHESDRLAATAHDTASISQRSNCWVEPRRRTSRQARQTIIAVNPTKPKYTAPLVMSCRAGQGSGTRSLQPNPGPRRHRSGRPGAALVQHFSRGAGPARPHSGAHATTMAK